MIGMHILQPAVTLAIWTMVIAAWMYATRIPALTRANLSAEELSHLNQGKLDAVLPPQVQWKAQNYNHLHEAPTVFYAVAAVLAITEQGDGIAAALGWTYLGLRIVHSLVHVTANKVLLRFQVYMASTLVLIALIVLAAIAVF